MKNILHINKKSITFESPKRDESEQYQNVADSETGRVLESHSKC